MAFDDDIIEISDDEQDERDDGYVSDNTSRRAFLAPIVQGVVDALGGFENGVYRMGDQVTGCLKDLKKLWRRDESDDERTVARIFYETRVLSNDLIPILLVTAGKGHVEDKRAVSCTDLIMAMTWPIDLAEELKELDDVLDRGADYTQLLTSHLHYKASLLQPGVIQALFGLVLPPLAKDRKSRTERDGQIVNIVLHLIRNLAFIRDLPPNTHASADQVEFSTLQSKLLKTLEETHMLELILTVAANTDKDPLFDSWNTVVLEILYLLFRGVKSGTLLADPVKQPTKNLHNLLAQEDRIKREFTRQGPTRHSRFGTTVAVKLNPAKNQKPVASDTTDSTAAPSAAQNQPQRQFVLHHQQAITGAQKTSTSSLWDLSKKQKFGSSKKTLSIDSVGLGREDNLNAKAKEVLKKLGEDFLEGCFGSFLNTLLKDIRSERAKVTEKDNLRLLFLTKWFLEFFLSLRSAEQGDISASPPKDKNRWNFNLIAEVVEREWIIWVLKRMREAGDEKPKAWTELQAGIECLTQLLLLIDTMASSSTDSDPPSSEPNLKETSLTLLTHLTYSGEILDITLDSLKSYKEGTQSLVYLGASVNMAWALLRVLERWSKLNGEGEYVRQTKKKKRRRGKGKGKGEEGDGVGDVPDEEMEEEEEEEEVIHETMFTFEAFELKFAHPEITRTLLAYLSRYKEFISSPTSPSLGSGGNISEGSEQMRRIVSLLHRQAVRAKAEGLFFNVSTLSLFQSILADYKAGVFPLHSTSAADGKSSSKETQPYKDLKNLVNYVLRQFFKALEKDTFLAVEAFFPKNRGQWKQYSSLDPSSSKSKNKKANALEEDSRFPPDVQVKPKLKLSWSDQVGVAIAALVEKGETGLILWVQEILQTAKSQRQRVIDEVDGDGEKSGDDENENQNEENQEKAKLAALKLNVPSADARAKLSDYLIPYVDDDQAEAATKNPQLKLLFRLSKFFVLEEDATELEWYIPSAILPSELERTYNVIQQYLENPFDLAGKKAGDWMSKKRKRRTRRFRKEESDEDGDADKRVRQERKEKKKKETQVYKSAQFIEDSDEEYGDLDKFLEEEKVRREKTAMRAIELGEGKSGAMRNQGTKKRRRKAGEGEGERKKGKKRKVDGQGPAEIETGADSEDSDVGVVNSK
ncbi:timeless-domain-containing protein, partial [Dendrothele bispora CBS 962.96]